MSSDTDPIERKVQLTGGSTYTVSLPKEWAGGQRIEAGSQVNLYVRGDQLVITRGKTADEPREATIDATDRDATTLSLAVGSAYVAGCDEIRIEGLDDTSDRRTVTRSIRRFVGLEIMTEDETSLTARTMLDAADLSPAQTLAQIERTTLEMHADAILAVTKTDGELSKQVIQQDDTVDRLFALISRGFQRSLVDPSVALSRNGLSSFEYYMAARQLERVADHAEKIARIADRLDTAPPEDVAQAMETYGKRARNVISDSLAGLLDGHPELTAVIVEAERLLSDIERLDETLYNTASDDRYHHGVVLDSVERTTQYGVNIAEAGLQARYRANK